MSCKTFSYSKKHDGETCRCNNNTADDNEPLCLTMKRAVNCIAYQVSHGGDIQKITVTSTIEPKVKDLMCEIEKCLKVQCCKQLLIYKGIKLNECPGMTLKELGVFPMSIIRLAGIRDEASGSLM